MTYLEWLQENNDKIINILNYEKEIDYIGQNKDYFVYQAQKACEYCPNNPNNGGSGICHCILGSSVIY